MSKIKEIDFYTEVIKQTKELIVLMVVPLENRVEYDKRLKKLEKFVNKYTKENT